MDLVTAGASAVLAPGLLSPLASRLPGGQYAPVLLGGAMLFVSTKVDGLPKAVAAGAGAGLIAASLVPLIVPAVSR